MIDKFRDFKEKIRQIYDNDIKINLSPASSFRGRCEFGYQNDFYIMHKNDAKIKITYFNDACSSIKTIMPLLLKEINKSKVLKSKLFQINFRSNNKNELMVTLIYHKKIDQSLIDEINKLSNRININIILRSKNFKYFTNSEYLSNFIDHDQYQTFQTDNCFYQPNIFLLDNMINSIKDMVDESNDLLELYCGVGTFTLPLSKLFKKILATENNRSSIKCLNKAIDINKLSNIDSVRLSAQEVSQFINGRYFKRMGGKTVSSYNFSHILVDPPRSGLTNEVIELISKFENIIYISCNPNTYIRDINLLKKHQLINIEIFDQFPNKPHMELISLLQK